MRLPLFIWLFTCLALTAQAQVTETAAAREQRLENGTVRLIWVQSDQGWRLTTAGLHDGDRWVAAGNPSGEYTILFSPTAPAAEGVPPAWRGDPAGFPEPSYKHTTLMWRQANSPVALNQAGTPVAFFPAEAMRLPDGSLRFRAKNDFAAVESNWKLSADFPSDIEVTITLRARQSGFYSVGTPTLAVVPREELAWAMVPGVFAGAAFEPDFERAYGYGQGLPDRPVLARERTASTLLALTTGKNGATTAVIAAPATAADPWAKDKNTRDEWRLGLSHLNRRGEIAPTLWHPVLGQEGSKLAVGENCTFSFRYTLRKADWFAVLNHAAYDIYRLADSLALRRSPSSLSTRLERLHQYLTDPVLSKWRTEEFNGTTIGAQTYGTAGGSNVIGSDRDAIKNSDYGAMWMLASLTGDPRIVRERLPYARAFKLAQQQTDPGFFQGAAVGQYYLYKSHRFIEEWGAYVEPVALTYYTLSDLGNILLFNPQDNEARTRLRLGAERLLSWQHPDGHWEVGYDRHSEQPSFTDLSDYRPTFCGLLIAWRILGEEKYLAAARRGADWLIAHAVEPQRYLGVCGDARFAPDFATAQIAQALLDLGDATGDARYRAAGISAAQFYATSIYTHPLATLAPKQVGAVTRADWEINQTGLGFEHGGTLGSANRNGPILLASHAGLFIRVHQLTGDPLLRDLARAGALGREAFADPSTGVLSYYWSRMDGGAGPYPHHAWWQIGWIMDYLISEATLRSGGGITFPRGFFTPKVGPHASYGFAPGKIYGADASLEWGGVDCAQPEIDSILATSTDHKRRFTLLLNDSGRTVTAALRATDNSATLISTDGARRALAEDAGLWRIPLTPWDLVVIETEAFVKGKK